MHNATCLLKRQHIVQMQYLQWKNFNINKILKPYSILKIQEFKKKVT